MNCVKHSSGASGALDFTSIPKRGATASTTNCSFSFSFCVVENGCHGIVYVCVRKSCQMFTRSTVFRYTKLSKSCCFIGMLLCGFLHAVPALPFNRCSCPIHTHACWGACPSDKWCPCWKFIPILVAAPSFDHCFLFFFVVVVVFVLKIPLFRSFLCDFPSFPNVVCVVLQGLLWWRWFCCWCTMVPHKIRKETNPLRNLQHLQTNWLISLHFGERPLAISTFSLTSIFQFATANCWLFVGSSSSSSSSSKQL